MRRWKQAAVVTLLACLLAALPRAAAGAANVTLDGGVPSPPATYYGAVLGAPGFVPIPGMPVSALIDGHICGQSSTIEQGGSIVYSVNVVGEGPGGIEGCGAPGRTVVLRIAAQTMAPVAPWDNVGPHSLSLQLMQPPVGPVVSIERTGETLDLAWPAVTLDTANNATLINSYRIWRGLQPYFDPTQPDCGCSLIAAITGLTYTDSGAEGADVVGDVAHNYTYVVKAVNAAGESAAGTRVGEFDFALAPGVSSVAVPQAGRQPD